MVRRSADQLPAKVYDALNSWDSSGELASFYYEVSEVDLPDLGPGYFIHPVDAVVEGARNGNQPTRLAGAAEGSIVVFGSDGGGLLFALHTPEGPVVRLSGGAFVGDTYDVDDSGYVVVASKFSEFLDFLLEALRRG